MDIAIVGEGELVICFIDKTGHTLMQERLVVSGSATMETLRVVELSLQTINGTAALAPVLIRRSNPKQRVTFDRETPSRFTRKRCKEIGCASKIAGDAARGFARPSVPGDGPFQASDDPALDRLIKSADRHIRRRR